MKNEKFYNEIFSPKDIKDKLKKSRIKLGLRRIDVEEKTSIPASTLFQYENGILEKIPANIVLKLAQIYNKPIHYFYTWVNLTPFTTLAGVVVGCFNGIYPFVLMASLGFVLGEGLKISITKFLLNLYNMKSFDKIENSIPNDKKENYFIIKNGISNNWNLGKLFTSSQLKYELSFLLAYYMAHIYKEEEKRIDGNAACEKEIFSEKYDNYKENINRTTHIFNYNKLGEKLKDARENKGYTIKKVSTILDIPAETISKYENGVIKNISNEILEMFSELYKENFLTMNILYFAPVFATATGLALMILSGISLNKEILYGFYSASMIGSIVIKKSIKKYSHKSKEDILSSLSPEKQKSYRINKEFLYETWKTEHLFTEEEIRKDEGIIFSIFLASIMSEESKNIIENNKDVNILPKGRK